MPMPKPELSKAFDMTPEDAVAYFRSKGFQITDQWQEMQTRAHAKAFTVAKVMRMDVLQTIRNGLDDALAEGLTEYEFSKRLTPYLQKEGWWGKQIWADKLGNAREVQLGSPHRLKTIYRANVATAKMAGQYRRQLAVAENRPYWMYISVKDSKTRPSHRRLNGKVFHFQDPIWRYIYPPNGWGCRCNVRTLSARQVERLNVPIENGEKFIETFQAESGVNVRTGEVMTVDHVRLNLPDGETMSPDVGWAYNPGEAAFGADMVVARKLATVKSVELRSQLIQSLNNSEERQRQFAVWASDVLEKRRPGHSVQTVGFMPETVSQLVKARTGIEPVRLMVINEKHLVHADSQKHHDLGVAIDQEQILALPLMIQNPETVIWDSQGDALLLLYPSESMKVKIVVRLDRHLKKQPQKQDEVVNIFKVLASDYQDKNKYEVLAGELKLN